MIVMSLTWGTTDSNNDVFLAKSFRAFMEERLTMAPEDAAFICRSVIRGQATDDSDTDIFFCTRERTQGVGIAFPSLCREIHRRLTLSPEVSYRRKCVTFAEVEAALRLVDCIRPTDVIRRSDLWGAVAWTSKLHDSQLAPVRSYKARLKTPPRFGGVLQAWLQHHGCGLPSQQEPISYGTAEKG